MRKQKKGRKLGRVSKQRKALMKSLFNNLTRDGKIKTTEAKAKEMRPKFEKIISRAKKDTVANRRIIATYLTQSMTKKMFEDVAKKYADRNGGYTRITKLGARRGDAGKMAVIELV
ncbi:MAG: 50S ribosomal protein L17 [Candidatus Pacebacteria bacterium]|nr:50S ribosomal protein L17 [Candidatus Paceibacterota bacterium]